MSDGEELKALDLARIMELLPHRYPFLLVDKIVDVARDGSKARGVKNVTYNEPFFPGHFPQKAVMPGVLIIEAMAQAAAAYTADFENFDMTGKVVYFLSIDNVRFRRPVVPGDRLDLHVSVAKRRPPIWKFRGEAMVEGKLCAEADFSAMLVDAKE